MSDDKRALPDIAAPPAVPDIKAAWLPRRKATLITYEKGAIEARDRPTGRLIAWYEPGLALPELPDLVALFPSPPDAWFHARIAGLLMEAEHSILRGRVTPRDMRKALGKMIGRPERASDILRDNPVLARTLGLQAIYTGAPIDKRTLVKARRAFKAERGRHADENRRFLLEEVTRLAVDYGLDLRLPQHRDERDSGVTPFFTFARAMIGAVITRVFERAPNPDKIVIRRLAPFRCSRVALLDALERAKERVKSP
jgi:hypothetical protein